MSARKLLLGAVSVAAMVMTAPARFAAQARPAAPPTAPTTGLRLTCDGDTVSEIEIRAHPPSVNGVAAEAWETTTQAAGLHHTTTRSAVIASYLRVEVGRVCTELDISESERLLRAQPFISSASVRVFRAGTKRARLQVDVVDELPVVIGGSISRGTVASILLGSQNLDGLGLTVELSAQRGFSYRTGFGVRAVQYGAFGHPDYVAVAAERTPVGEAGSLEFAEPFLTDLQIRAYRASISEASDYYSVRRPVGADVSLFTRRTAYDIGWVTRLWRRGGRGTVGLVGAALLGEDVRTGTRAVVISDTGFVDVPESEFGTRYPARAAVRLAAIGGLRSLRFTTVQGFDALNARQDVGIGVQFDLLAGSSVWASRDARDVFVASDLYAGIGDERSFFAARALVEASSNRDEGRWDRMVASSRLSWYGKPASARTEIVSLEFSAVGRLSFPVQLTFGDADGGIRGFRDASYAGGQRVVARVEERRMLPLFTRRADFALALFADAGKLWAGDVPYGTTTAVHGALGLSLLGAYPAGGKRTYRVDFAVPLNPERGGPRFELRLSSTDRTRLLWLEPFDVSRARTGAVPANLMKW